MTQIIVRNAPITVEVGTGPRGPKGDQGDTGPQGDSIKGDTGDQGIPGPPGAGNGVGAVHGTGSPIGVVAATVGTKYIDTAATNGAIEWVKYTGSGNTGWRVAFGDTGRRNITSILENGWIAVYGGFIHRVGDICTIKLDGTIGTSATSSVLYTLPIGFRPMDNYVSGIVQNNALLAAASQRSIMVMANGQVLVDHTIPNGFYGQVSWLATGGWPTVLPGVAA